MIAGGELKTEDNADGVIEGRNAIIEALRAGVAIDKVFITKGETDPALLYIASAARGSGAVVVETDRRKLDSMSKRHAHRGVIALAARKEYVTVSDILEIAKQRKEEPHIVLCDGISDPHNLGAIIRSCEAAGVHGVIIPKHRSAGLTATVVKTSSGSIYHMAIARVTNLSSTIEELKEAGVWVFGISPDGKEPLWECDFTGSAAFVIGSEGAGLSRLVSEKCDLSIRIPMYGKVASLNASVSAAIMVYEAARQRAALR